jgi:hypothetical protein
MAELITLLRAGRAISKRTGCVAFSIRVAGIGLVLWASVSSASSGSRLDFQAMTPASSLYLLIAAGLRLGVIPLHLPFSSESITRRGIGTAMRLIFAASSLILLARIPLGGTSYLLMPLLFILTAIAAIYSGWMGWCSRMTWQDAHFRSSDSLLAVAHTAGQPIGAVMGCGFILAGAAFLVIGAALWLNRALLVAAFGLSSLPFSLTASGWKVSSPFFYLILPFMLAAQAMLVAGYVRHALRPGVRENIETLPSWSRNVYPAGIAIRSDHPCAREGWEGRQMGLGWPQRLQ